MVKNRVLATIQCADLARDVKPINGTWVCKKKSNGVHGERLKARGFHQVGGQHHGSLIISAPVTNCITIKVIMMNQAALVVDIKEHFYMDNLKMVRQSTWKYLWDRKIFTQIMWYSCLRRHYMDLSKK